MSSLLMVSQVNLAGPRLSRSAWTLRFMWWHASSVVQAYSAGVRMLRVQVSVSRVLARLQQGLQGLQIVEGKLFTRSLVCLLVNAKGAGPDRSQGPGAARAWCVQCVLARVDE